MDAPPVDIFLNPTVTIGGREYPGGIIVYVGGTIVNRIKKGSRKYGALAALLSLAGEDVPFHGTTCRNLCISKDEFDQYLQRWTEVQEE